MNDTVPAERAKGFELEAAWLFVAEKVAVYTDYGLSDGMKNTLSRTDLPVDYREIGK